MSTKHSFDFDPTSWVYSHTIFPPCFSSVEQFTSTYGITLPRPKQRIDKSLVWRLTDRIKGQVNGLPETWGILQATNGVLCYIEQGYGRVAGSDVPLVLGHLQWFVPDEREHFEYVKKECSVKAQAILDAEVKFRLALLEDY